MTIPESLPYTFTEVDGPDPSRKPIDLCETLAAILAELREIKQHLTAKPAPRVFVPEDVRRALGADLVQMVQHGNMWQLAVRYGPVARALGPIQEETAYYTALSSEGFSTAEAIEIINRQRPTVPA